MVSHLDSLVSNNHTVSVYFIEDVITNTNTSTKSIISANITTDKDKLNDKLKKVQSAFKQPHIRSTRKMYQYKDKFMYIENSNNYTFFKETEISSCLSLSLDDNKTIVRITDTTSISKEQIPIISNYSNVCTQRIRTVVYGPDDAVKIHFIEETSEGKSANGEPVYYVLVQFVNSNKEVLDSCKDVIKLLS